MRKRQQALVQKIGLYKIAFAMILLALLVVGCGTSAQSEGTTATTTPTPQPTTASQPTPTPTAKKSTNTQQQAKIGKPIRLIVPRINVNAAVETSGVLPDGSMEPPQKNPWDGVGWYADGARPGEKGSAVIAGHLDRPGGAPAVFWDLRQLKSGDKLMVVDDMGVTRQFVVKKVDQYAPKEAPVQDIFGNSSGKYLNLITCAGDWIPAEKQTTLRLVVYAVMQ